MQCILNSVMCNCIHQRKLKILRPLLFHEYWSWRNCQVAHKLFPQIYCDKLIQVKGYITYHFPSPLLFAFLQHFDTELMVFFCCKKRNVLKVYDGFNLYASMDYGTSKVEAFQTFDSQATLHSCNLILQLETNLKFQQWFCAYISV